MASPRLKRTVQGVYSREERKKGKKSHLKGGNGGIKKLADSKKLVTGTRPLQTKAG